MLLGKNRAQGGTCCCRMLSSHLWHQVMCLWRTLCQMLSVHPGKGRYLYAVPCAFLVLFPWYSQSFGSEQHVPRMLRSCLVSLDPRPICCSSWLVVEVLGLRQEQLWLLHRSRHAGRVLLTGQTRGKHLITPVSGLTPLWRSGKDDSMRL